MRESYQIDKDSKKLNEYQTFNHSKQKLEICIKSLPSNRHYLSKPTKITTNLHNKNIDHLQCTIKIKSNSLNIYAVPI